MALLNNLKIQRKLLILLGLSALALVVATLAAALLLHDRMMDERVAKLRAVVDLVHGAATGLDAREKAGEFGHDEALKRFRDAVHSMRFEDDNYIFVHDLNGINLAHGADPKEEGTDRSQNKDSAGTLYVQDMIKVARSAAGEGIVDYVYPRASGGKPLPKIGYIKQFGPWNALIGAGVYVDDIDAAFWNALGVLSAIGAAVLALLALAGWLISRNIAQPLSALQGKMEALATGNLAVEITDTGRRDEVGGMTRAVLVFKENALAVERLRTEQEELKHKAAAQKTEAMHALADSFDHTVMTIVQSLETAAAEMETTARSMSGTAARTKGRRAGRLLRLAPDLGQCPDRGRRLGRAVEIDRRDQQPRRALLAHRRRGGRDRPAHQRHGREPGPDRAEDRRGRGADQPDRQPDQSAGAQRHDRGGPRRRGRQGLRRGRERGQEPGDPDDPCDRRHPRPDQRDPDRDAGRRDRDPRDLPHRGPGRGDRDLDRERRGGTGRRHQRNRPQHPAGRHGHRAGAAQHLGRERRGDGSRVGSGAGAGRGGGAERAFGEVAG
ncbi:MAG: cache domain-containing protein [Aliidongia sp.]